MPSNLELIKARAMKERDAKEAAQIAEESQHVFIPTTKWVTDERLETIWLAESVIRLAEALRFAKILALNPDERIDYNEVADHVDRTLADAAKGCGG